MKKIVYDSIGIVLILVLVTAIIGSALITSEDTTPPVVTNASANPPSIPADGATTSQLNVTVTDESGVDVVVIIDLSAIGGSDTHVTHYLGNDVYSTGTTAAEGTAPGAYFLRVNATDINGNYNDTVSIALEVTTAAWDPWIYDTNGDGVIDKSEAIDAVQDYFDDIITKEQALDVIQLYFR